MYNTLMYIHACMCKNIVRGSAESKFHTMSVQDWLAADYTSCTFWAGSGPAGMVWEQSPLVLLMVLVSLT